MEINIGNFGSKGIMPETFGTNGVDAKRGTTDAAGIARQAPNLTIGEGPAGLAAAEPVADVSEADLSRDDDLGRLMSKVFTLQPPPMPDFAAASSI